MRTILLNDGNMIPQLGLGMMWIPQESLHTVLADACELGFRHFDTATHYGNEVAIGDGLRALAIDRNDLFVTTKLPNAQHGYDKTLRAFEKSEAALGKIDLYLIHWPQPTKALYRESWRAMARLRDEGRVRSIGVANFVPQLIIEIVDDTGVTPALNQVELHPRYQQRALRAFHADRGIATESWSPLEQGRALLNPTICRIAEKHGCTSAQVILRWHLSQDLVVIPKASSHDHLVKNFNMEFLDLDARDIAEINALDDPQGAFGPDPMVHSTQQGAE